MARQRGEIKLQGKIGDLLFYKSAYGFLARKIGEVSEMERKTGENYARPRENNSELGYSSRIGKLIRQGVSNSCALAETGTTHHRLNAVIRKALLADTEGERGKRRLMQDNVARLNGFGWKEGLPLYNVLGKSYLMTLNAGDGSATLSVASLVPAEDVDAGDGASHVELTLVLVAVDYDKNSKVSVCDRTGMIALDNRSSVAINLSCALAEYSGRVLVGGVGVQPYQMVAGEMVPLMERSVFEIGAVGVG